ncbi:unnamed protein product [Paramecium pentaurelia]|uniref:Myb-like DNA-binding domain containing protein n=1 Tax=Paramecium pentaurelia TaxID=43138 RepID=A0A8S1RWE2_9CILI|nr:unnamed protein product [Paramecium pentaurelia]
MFQNIVQESSYLEKEISVFDLHSPKTMDQQSIHDQESNFHLSFFTDEPIQKNRDQVSSLMLLKEEKTYSNYKNQDRSKIKQKVWNDEEDQKLKYLFNLYQGKWIEIAKCMPQRNASQCQQRWRRINPSKYIKHIWTQQEDDQLKQLVSKLGRKWVKIAKFLGNITGKQVRDHYINKLDESISRDPWSYEEDMFILNYFVTNGPKWTQISNLLVGRPENHVKNRFYSFIVRNYLGQQSRYQIIYS